MPQSHSVTLEFSVSLVLSTMVRTPPRITFTVNGRRVNGALQARRRRRMPIRRQISPAERKRRRETSEINSTALDTAIEDWFQFTLTTAQELGKRFSHQPRWVLNKMFYCGAHVKKRSKTNAWNAWASKMCAELNTGKYDLPPPNSQDSRRAGCEEGNVVSLMEVREKYGDQYAALTPMEKEKLVEEFESKRVDPAAPRTRVTTQSRVQDFANTYDQIIGLVRGNTFAWLVANIYILSRCRA